MNSMDNFRKRLDWTLALLLAWGALCLGVLVGTGAAQEPITFQMVPSAGAASCLPDATAQVVISPVDQVELMTISVDGLPPNTAFDFFVIQLPHAPFGLSWYQGDIQTDETGSAGKTFIGRFSIETFIVAPGSGQAPVVHTEPPFPDADSNPPTAPVHTFHLGLWFNSPDDAAAAGCLATVTPFNGNHHAGIQALTTTNFPDEAGPLCQLIP